MKLYFISGLGADKQVFGRFRFEDHTCHFIDWIPPEKRESLPHYAKRLTSQIDSTEDFALIGVSFGGMLATEMTEILQPKATVLISSLPRFRAFGKVRQIFRHLPIPGKILALSLPLFLWIAPLLFSVKEKSEKQFLKKIIRETDPQFVSWAVAAILSWKRKTVPKGILGIHGTRDFLIPVFLRRSYVKLQGGHFIVWQKAHDIEEIIKSHLQELN